MPGPASPPPGFYDDAEGRRRWWDGSGWADVFEPRRTEPDHREVLDAAVTTYVKHGYRVESTTATQAVVGKRRQVRVLLNVVLTIVTGGLWLIVLLIRLLDWPVDRVVLTIDDRGELQAEFR